MQLTAIENAYNSSFGKRIADTLLVNRIARAHGLQRIGRIITERVTTERVMDIA